MKKEIGALLLLSTVMFSGCSSDNTQKQDSNELSSEQQETQQDTVEAKLIGISEDKKVKLYENINGVMLDINGNQKELSWNYPGDTGTTPQVFYTDVTGDGEKEAVIILSIGRGTELSTFDIHIVNKMLHEIKVQNYEEIVADHIESSIVKKDENTIGLTVKVQGKEHDFDLSSFGFHPQEISMLEQDKLIFGSQVTYFLEEQKIKLNLVGSIGIYGPPIYLVDFIITYKFDKTKNEFVADQIEVKPVEK
ncbi:hypothetical protein [Solibacillus sp. FSL K6-1523]|uniref:hypothetical protein n=1 Tax=Solibacillus sp. FSL K6-1523 TaxID=2921471 RepID=UPI0030F57E15